MRELSGGWVYESNVTCVVCPACSFTFSVEHYGGDSHDSGYECPNCHEEERPLEKPHLTIEGADGNYIFVDEGPGPDHVPTIAAALELAKGNINRTTIILAPGHEERIAAPLVMEGYRGAYGVPGKDEP